MKIKRSVFKFEVYGKKVSLRAPVLKELIEHEAQINSGKNELAIMMEFLQSLGMEEELVNELEPAHMVQIIEAISKGDAEKK